MIDDNRPMFLQIAGFVESDILDGTLADEAQIPFRQRVRGALAARRTGQFFEQCVRPPACGR